MSNGEMAYPQKSSTIPHAEAIAAKELLVQQLTVVMTQQGMTKRAMAEELQTSRSQLDRLLDPQNINVSLETIARAARVLGKRLTVKVEDGGTLQDLENRPGKKTAKGVTAEIEPQLGRRKAAS